MEQKLTKQELAIAARRELRRELETRRIRDDEVYFFENYVYIENKDGKTPEERSILFKMFPEQKRALKEINENKNNIILKARQLGITWMAVGHGTHGCIKMPQYTTVILSQTEDYMKEAIDRFEYVLERLPDWYMREYNKENSQLASLYLYEKKSDEITIYNPAKERGKRETSSIKGLVSTPSAGRSITADLIIFDEWAYHDNAEAVFQAAFPIINRPESGSFIGISTNQRGSFYEEKVVDAIENPDSIFNLIFLNVWADPRRNQRWYEITKAALPNTWMAEYPETIEQALSAGNLTAYPEFSPSIHVIEPFEIPKHWIRWAAVDNGYSDPFVWLKGAVSEDGTTYIYYEYSRDKKKDPKVHYSDQARQFMRDCTVEVTDEVMQEVDELNLGYQLPEDYKHYEKENLQYVIFGLDAFTGHVRDTAGKTLLTYYEEGGFNYPTTKAVTNRKLKVDTLKEYLKSYTDDFTGETRAKLQIFSTCKFTIKYLPQLTLDEKNTDVVADNSNIDNIHDCLAYLLIGSPKNNSKPIEKPESIIQKIQASKD